jgi:hypothetical protein
MTEHESYLEEVIIWIVMTILYVIDSILCKRICSINL